MSDTLNLSSNFETNNSVTEDNNIKNDVISNEEIREDESINVTASVRNVETVNEDIPSFREWTKKQLEEAEKQPGINQ